MSQKTIVDIAVIVKETHMLAATHRKMDGLQTILQIVKFIANNFKDVLKKNQ